MTCECGEMMTRNNLHTHKLSDCCLNPVVQLKNTISRLEEGLVLHDRALTELKERLLEVESTSFHGISVWNITGFSRRRQEAINGRTPSIYSTPFYTSRAGYKMCVRIYLNGDGMGKEPISLSSLSS